MIVVQVIVMSFVMVSTVSGYSELQCDDGVSECCDIAESGGCMLSDLPISRSTLIFPGGDTECISSASTPFAFGTCQLLIHAFTYHNRDQRYTEETPTKFSSTFRVAVPAGIKTP